MNDDNKKGRLKEMFSDEVLEILMDEKNQGLDVFNPSGELLLFFDDHKEELIEFENEILERKNKTIKGFWIVYKKYESKVKDKKNEAVKENDIEVVDENEKSVIPAAEVITQTGYSHLSEAEQQKRNQEIANIPVTDIINVDNKHHQLDLFILRFPVFALKHDKKSTTFKFENRKGLEITLRSNDLGRATIQDSDLWLYCISKMMQLIFEMSKGLVAKKDKNRSTGLKMALRKKKTIFKIKDGFVLLIA